MGLAATPNEAALCRYATGSRIGSERTDRGELRANSEISTGSMIRVTIGASAMSPTTTTASGFCTCEPMPDDSAAGSEPVRVGNRVRGDPRVRRDKLCPRG